jgi:leader peptidase (prepilin peptidase)/N-methyltransferase
MCQIADWMVLALLVACAICDWKWREIPLYLLIVMSVDVLILAIGCGGLRLGLRLGGALVGVLFFLIGKCTKEAIGYGDSWLMLLLGVYLGAMQLLQLLFIASVVAGIMSLFFLWKKRWKKTVAIPFVPFLVVGYLGVVFL